MFIASSVPRGHAQVIIAKDNDDGTSTQTSQLPPSDIISSQSSHEPSARPSPPLGDDFGPTGIASSSESPSSIRMPPSPTTSETEGLAPSDIMESTCQNTPGFLVKSWIWEEPSVFCDNYRLFCYDQGNLGLAKDHCCICKGPECKPFCNDTDFANGKNTMSTDSDEDAMADNDEGDDNTIVILIGCSLAVLCLFGGAYAIPKYRHRRRLRNRYGSA
ncbi:unnamed protein product [Cylindrotheca closterium]|uniref:Uncharacterized protein n=1 Tax=Cylindrotheca closterium TaxID=2856 RepID=A0AAD2PVR4_9STRA|nr:unnamed protein product [Cylindrotheca closterium]